MSTLGFVVEQAPQAMGYALYSMTLKADGGLDKQPVAFCTSLVEVTVIRGRMEKDAFGTEALPPREKEVHYLQPPNIPPQQQPQHQPFELNGTYPNVPLHDRPKVVNDIEYPPDAPGEPSTYGKIKQAMDNIKGRGHALAWFAILTVSYLGTRIA